MPSTRKARNLLREKNWDESITDLARYKLTKEQQLQKKLQLRSKNNVLHFPNRRKKKQKARKEVVLVSILDVLLVDR